MGLYRVVFELLPFSKHFFPTEIAVTFAEIAVQKR